MRFTSGIAALIVSAALAGCLSGQEERPLRIASAQAAADDGALALSQLLDAHNATVGQLNRGAGVQPKPPNDCN